MLSIIGRGNGMRERSPSLPVTLPQSVKRLLQDKAYGHVVTFNAQGDAQLTMVWMDVDGDEVLFNTAEGRKKPQNLRRDPRIIVSVQDRSDPQAHAVFRGKAQVTETGADDHIDKLAKRFLNVDKYPFRQPGEKRLIVRISVDRIGGFGPKMQPW
jgi:PPOX class probable F420-dependent enzyme